MHRHSIVVFVFCLLMSYIAEEFFGVADITGAFIAGLIVSCTHKEKYVSAKFDTLSYLLLSPVFFASIGLKVELPKMNLTLVTFAVVLTVVAVLTKVVGCRLGSGALETLIIFVAVDCLRPEDALWGNVVKLITSVLVVIVNYVGSKLLVFRKK